MKEFLRTLLACVIAVMIALYLLLVILRAGLSGEGIAPLPKTAILVLGPDVVVNDAGGAPAWSDAAQGAAIPVPLRRLVDALDAAAAEERIVGILLHEGGPQCEDWAQLRELRAALARFRSSGKPIWAYATAWDEPSWYLGTTAEEVLIAPLGLFECNGFAAEMFYFADALAKIGVNVQTTRVGKYKSAVEPFTLSQSSAENDEQMQAVLASLENAFLDDCAAARRLEPAALRAFMQSGGVCSAPEAVERGFLDKVAPWDEMLDTLGKRAGVDPDSGSFQQISCADWLTKAEDGRRGDVLVAVVHASGDIVDGESTVQVGGATLARRLRELRLDPEVHAVVLRVNSPGGSALASEVIRREVELLRAVKPIVVSMGGLAASGGYWISCSATRILAEPSTITGSIGVLALLPDFSPLMERVGVHVSTVRTAPYADAMSVFRARTPEELAGVQEVVDDIYAAFLDRVAAGRNLSRERVDEIAQGRIWSGTDALELGLVDAIGSLGDAIRAAASLGGAVDGRFRVRGGEREPSPVDLMLSDLLGGGSEPLAVIPASLLQAAREAWSQAQDAAAGPVLLARLPFRLTIR
jgi:protease-4